MINRKRQYGLTIVELLVAMALSAVLATALYRIVIANKEGMGVTEAYSKIQDATRTAFDLLEYDLRMINYRGCMNVNDVEYLSKTGTTLDESSAGYDPNLHNFKEQRTVESRANYVSPDNITAAAGSSVIVLRSAIPLDLVVSKTTTNNTEIEVTGRENQIKSLEAGDIMMITDCEKAHFFAASNIDSSSSPYVIRHDIDITTGVNNTDPIFKDEFGNPVPYTKGSQLLLMESKAYFVGESRLWQNSGINSLYVVNSMESGLQSNELVPYVQKMEVEYLVENSVGGPSYVSSPLAGQQILAIRVELEMASDKSCTAANANPNSCLDPQTYERIFFVRNSRGQ